MITKTHSDNEYPDKIETLPLVKRFGTDRAIPLEVVYFEDKEKEPYETGNFFMSEVVALSDDRAQIQFRETSTQKLLPQLLVFTSDGKMRVVGGTSASAGIDDFLADNYSEWCGKWHKGFGGRRWRICTGSDCNPGIAICFQHELPDL